jgi:hypothetical protein
VVGVRRLPPSLAFKVSCKTITCTSSVRHNIQQRHNAERTKLTHSIIHEHLKTTNKKQIKLTV